MKSENKRNENNESYESSDRTGICIVCGKEYKIYQISRQKYCSANCRVKGNKDKTKQRFGFLEAEYRKPKLKSEVIKKKNTDWLLFEQKIIKHKKQSETLKEKKTRAELELSRLVDKNKNTIIYALIGAGITTVGGYILFKSPKKNGTPGKKKNEIIKTVKIGAAVPIGVLLAGLAMIGFGLGYAVAYIENTISMKSRKTLEHINTLNETINVLTGQIRLEEMNIEDLSSQQILVNEYESITETVSKSEVVY